MTRYGQDGTILVVDDNIEIRTFTKAFLEHAGYCVITAADGQDGLRSYEIHQPNIVLLLTDVCMPNMDGLELADRVLRLDSRLPVLFMSGDKCAADRGFGCLEKPFRPAELMERVSRALHANARLERTAPAA